MKRKVNRKVMGIIFGVGGLIILVLFLIAFIQHTKDVKLLEEGLALINDGEYDAALEVCREMRAGTGICYSSIMGKRLSENDDLTVEFCNSIPLDDENRFLATTSYKEKYRQKMSELRDECMVFAVVDITLASS